MISVSLLIWLSNFGWKQLRKINFTQCKGEKKGVRAPTIPKSCTSDLTEKKEKGRRKGEEGARWGGGIEWHTESLINYHYLYWLGSYNLESNIWVSSSSSLLIYEKPYFYRESNSTCRETIGSTNSIRKINLYFVFVFSIN